MYSKEKERKKREKEKHEAEERRRKENRNHRSDDQKNEHSYAQKKTTICYCCGGSHYVTECLKAATTPKSKWISNQGMHMYMERNKLTQKMKIRGTMMTTISQNR